MTIAGLPRPYQSLFTQNLGGFSSILLHFRVALSISIEYN